MVLSIQKQRDNLAQNPDKLGISAQYEAPVVLLKKWVDFEWEVDGKTYEYSLTGGGYLSFTELMELLCVADSDDVENFVSQVESVEFSNPDLVWVGKVEEDTTVGALKEANGLDVQYSAELTEEQILQIEAQTVKAGDWALLSLLPFDTEESLMIILQNGDEFTIKVTDAAELTLGLGGLSGLQSGTKFIIYIFDSDTKMEYVLKGNGETDPFDGTLDFHILGDEYQWTITKDSI